jgi:hypothetical protein
VDIIKQRARGIARIGHVLLAVGELPDQPRVDRAEGEFPGLGQAARAGHVIEHPFDLRGGKIGVEAQARLPADHRFTSARAQAVAAAGGVAILPDDRGMDGFAGTAVPDHGGFALVGDADGGDIPRTDFRAGKRFDRDGHLRGPDFLRIVLDPARLREELPDFLLRDGADAALVVEDQRAHARRTRVEGENKCHDSFYPRGTS